MKEPTICFVCNHGFGASRTERLAFERYLRMKEIQGVTALHAGVEGLEDGSKPRELFVSRIKESDILVLVSFVDVNKVRAFNPKGEVIELYSLLKENNLSDGRAYDFLVNLAYTLV